MTSNFFILICLFCAVSSLSAQETAPESSTIDRDIATYYHQQGTHSFNLGVGFPNLAGQAVSIIENLSGEESGSVSPQFTFKYEYALTNEIGIGLHTGFYTATTPKLSAETLTDIIPIDIVCCFQDPGGDCCFEQTTTETVDPGSTQINAFSIGGRFAYHFMRFKKLDTYTNAVLGYSFIREKTVGAERSEFNDAIAKVPTFVYFVSAGVRYYFMPEFAVYGEFGYGNITLVNLGLTYRL